MKAKALRQDVTCYVSPDFLSKYGIKTVYQVHIFDPDKAVHCCELTPSYELEPAGFDIDAGEDVDDKAWVACSEDGSFYPDLEYRHCSSVDSGRAGEVQDLGDEWEDLEDAIEYARGNGFCF